MPPDDDRPLDDEPPHSAVMYRELTVPEVATGMRLDRFLALRFADYSRTALARGVRAGGATDERDRPLRASTRLVAGQVLRLTLDGIGPTTPPPPFPPILHEDDRVVVVDKPAGLTCHPGGVRFAWALVGLARERWPDADLAHRLDRETSGIVVLTKDATANGFLKAAFREGRVEKVYVALCRGVIAEDRFEVDAPIGRANGPIRIQMAVTDDGLPARTSFEVIARSPDTTPPLTRVRCRLHTGRTHQIRVHLAHHGHGILGDRMYGVPPEVFLHYWDHGLDDSVIRRAGAPRQALHAHTVTFPHPDGDEVTLTAPIPAEMERWWQHPEVLPLDRPEEEA